MMNNYIPVNGRKLEINQLVEVYYNLHKKMYSIRDKKTGLVVAHAETVALVSKGDTFVTTKVSEAGRQRVLREKKKNVHAVIVGHFAGAGMRIAEEDKPKWKELYYNPYKVSTFVDKVTMQPPANMLYVHCQDKQAFYIN